MGAVGAHAVETVQHEVDSDNAEVVTLTQTQSDANGLGSISASDVNSLAILAGLARSDAAGPLGLIGPGYSITLPAVGTTGGDTLAVEPGALRPQNTTTPDPCNSAGNFGGGWCQTAHSVAANVFGWNFSAGGHGVIIGMVDTGIDLNSPEFLNGSGVSRVLPGYCVVSSVNPCTGDNAIGGDDTVFPGGDSTHGTHTTGIAAGLNVGIAYQASILPVKVCGSNVDSCIGVDQGIVWASQHGANIISVSIGGPVLAQSDIASFQTAVANGSLLVVAAGNSGNKDPVSGFLGGAALSDGVRGSMIVVGATGCNGPSSFTPDKLRKWRLRRHRDLQPGARHAMHGRRHAALLHGQLLRRRARRRYLVVRRQRRQRCRQLRLSLGHVDGDAVRRGRCGRHQRPMAAARHPARSPASYSRRRTILVHPASIPFTAAAKWTSPRQWDRSAKRSLRRADIFPAWRPERAAAA